MTEENTASPMVAALYVRVSTGRQEQEATIESQLDEVRVRIKNDSNILPSAIFVDDGWSGELLQRPQLDAMRDAAVEGKFQIVYVYDRGRLSRIFAHQEVIIEELTNKEVKFVTLHDVQAVTPEERVLQAMQGVFHEYERIKIVERMRRGKMFKAKSGILINGQALYGYNYVKKTDTTPAHYEINEKETDVVRKIFEWVCVEQISLNQVVKRLYDLGVPPRRGKSEFWTKGPIVRILKCDTYFKGFAYYNKIESVVTKKPLKNEKYKKIKKGSRRRRPKEEWISFRVPRIISEELGEKAGKILEYNRKYVRKNKKHDYLLSSVIYCECGCRLSGDGCNNNGHHYYRCIERIHTFPMKSKCKAKGVNAIVLDTIFWKELVKLLTNPKLLKEQASLWLNSQSDKRSQVEKLKLAKLLQAVQEEEARYAQAYGKGLLEFEQFRNLVKESKRRKLSYQNQIEELDKQTSVLEEAKISLDQLCSEAQRVLKSFDLDKDDIANKFVIVKDLIGKIIIKNGKEAEVFGHIALSTVKLEYEPIGRDSRLAKCRQKYAF